MFFRCLWLLLFALVFSSRIVCADQESQQPNIILLLADDLGYGELGCQGNPQIPTPAIDGLATAGVRFTQAYVTAPNCSPSRAGLLTGKVPLRFGYEFNPIGPRNDDPQTGLPPAEVTIAETLQNAGYTTGLIGKWHLGGAADYHPQRHGFDDFFGFLHEGHYFVPPPYHGVTTMLRRRSLPGNRRGRLEWDRLIYSTHMGHNEPDYDANNPILRHGQPVQEHEYLTDAFTREAVQFIERNRQRPFFLYVAYNAVHSPLQGADRYLEKFKHIPDIHRRIFAAMLANLDASVGSIVASLRKHQLERETLVIFLSDNGGPTRELTSSNRPLRGEKGSMYEGGLRVPLIMSWPGVLPKGRVEQRPVWSVDLFPTLATIGQADLPKSLDGVNLLPELIAPKSHEFHAEFYWRQGNRAAFRAGDWKIVRMGNRRQPGSWELYNVTSDQSEQTNLATEQPQRLKQLQQRWQKWNDQMRSPLF